MSQSPEITAVVDNGRLVYLRQDRLSVTYTKLHGIRDLHYFVMVQNLTTNHPMMSVRKLCNTGTTQPSDL